MNAEHCICVVERRFFEARDCVGDDHRRFLDAVIQLIGEQGCWCNAKEHLGVVDRCF